MPIANYPPQYLYAFLVFFFFNEIFDYVYVHILFANIVLYFESLFVTQSYAFLILSYNQKYPGTFLNY